MACRSNIVVAYFCALILLCVISVGEAFQPQQQPLVVSTIGSRKVNNLLDSKHYNGVRSSCSSSSSALFSSTSSTGATTASPLFSENSDDMPKLNKITSTLSKMAMIAYIVSLCITLPLVLLPQRLFPLEKPQKERWAMISGQFLCRWMLRFFPFCNVKCIAEKKDEDPEPTVWVCNHVSLLDFFLLMAHDKKLRGKNRRPIKCVYWKQLESNPISKLLFTQMGCIPVDMQANAAGEDNVYDKTTFKAMLKSIKQDVFAEGFDLGILPEGQLNPRPEQGLLPIFSGAYNFARMSRRPIQMMALYGTHNLWHPVDGMKVVSRDVSIRVYPYGRSYKSPEEFVQTFEKIVGHFGQYGQDMKNLDSWLDGSAWEFKLEQERLRKEAEEQERLRKEEEERLRKEAEEQEKLRLQKLKEDEEEQKLLALQSQADAET